MLGHDGPVSVVEEEAPHFDVFGNALEGINSRLRKRAQMAWDVAEEAEEGREEAKDGNAVLHHGLRNAGFQGLDEIVASAQNRESSQREVRRLRDEARTRVRRLEASLQCLRKQRETRIDALKARSRQFDADVDAALARQRLRQNAFERRVRSQEETATRRLQELVFESLGETEKTLERAHSCVKFRDRELRERLANTSEALQWKFLLRRLEEDALCVISAHELRAPRHKGKQEALWRLCHDEVRRFDANLCVERLASITYTPKFGVPASGSTIARTPPVGRDGPRTDISRRAMVFDSEQGSLAASLAAIFGDAGIRSENPLVADFSIRSGSARSGENLTSEEPSSKRRSQAPPGSVTVSRSSPKQCNGILGFDRRRVLHARRVNCCDLDMLLSARALTWLLWPSQGQSPVDLRIYFCLEERLAHHGPRDARCSTLGSIYLAPQHQSNICNDDLDVLRRGPRAERKGWPTHGMRVTRAEGRHRAHYSLSQLKEEATLRAVTSCPDVYTTSQPSLHFVPATLRELLASRTFFEMSRNSFSAEDRADMRSFFGHVAHEALNHLYVAMPLRNASDACVADNMAPIQDETFAQLQMVAVPRSAIEELVRTYLVRTTETSSIHSALDLAESDAFYSVAFPSRPGPGTGSANIEVQAARSEKRTVSKRGWSGNASTLSSAPRGQATAAPTTFAAEKDDEAGPAPHHAILVCCRTRSESDESRVSESSEAPDTLTRACLWRACNADRTPENALGLCGHHEQMHVALVRLDANSSQEIKRHLPRQSLETLRKKTDHAMVIKASSLVSELLTNKLASTVKGFCARAANTAKPRRKSSQARAPPSAADLLRTSQQRERKVQAELALAQMVSAAEAQVVQELEKMSNLNYFPRDELEIIRQEYRVLDEEREALFVDSTPSSLFRSRLCFLESEFGQLVGPLRTSAESESCCEKEDVSESADHGSERQPLVDEAKSHYGSPPGSRKVPRRERHLVEIELELDFSLRKIRILRATRERLEREAMLQDDGLPQSSPRHHAIADAEDARPRQSLGAARRVPLEYGRNPTGGPPGGTKLGNVSQKRKSRRQSLVAKRM